MGVTWLRTLGVGIERGCLELYEVVGLKEGKDLSEPSFAPSSLKIFYLHFFN
jgi:hypothetical protein